MRFLGIDYGTKRIGTAVSDGNGVLAFPKEIIKNDKNIIARIGEIIEEEKNSEIVVGESLSLKGEPNKIYMEVENFILELKTKFGLPIHKEKEFMTSVEARRYKIKDGSVDASAAALILQRYLDKINNKKSS